MKCLLRNLTKFIGTVLELYAPLPFQFTADLHTLNAYLRSYSENEEKMLQAFVDKLSEKLDYKMRYANNQNASNCQGSFSNALRHYNSCTIKYPQLKLNLQTESNQPLNLTYNALPQAQTKPIYSQRNINNEQGGIKSNRHKFGSKHRNRVKESNSEIDKQNLSLTFNLKEKDYNPKSLLSNLSQVQLISNSSTLKLHHDKSFKDRKQHNSKGIRPDSSDSRSTNPSLKIKLRPKPIIQMGKLRQGAQQILQFFHSHDTQMKQLFESLQSNQQTC